MAKYDLLESMRRTYELARRGYLYPDAIEAAESYYRFRMGDEAFEKAVRSERASYVNVSDLELNEEGVAAYLKRETSNG